MALAIIHTRAKSGIDAPPVTVEVHLSNGLLSLSIVGPINPFILSYVFQWVRVILVDIRIKFQLIHLITLTLFPLLSLTAEPYTAKVIGITDGDTLKVLTNQKRHTPK